MVNGFKLTLIILTTTAILLIAQIVVDAQAQVSMIEAHRSVALRTVQPVLPALVAGIDRKADDLDPSQLLIWCDNDTAYRPVVWPMKFVDGQYRDIYVIFPDGSKAFIARSGKVVGLQGRITGTIYQADIHNPNPWHVCDKTDQVLAVL
jgi:hypothetical protein